MITSYLRGINEIKVMRQFRKSRYWISEGGEVSKYYPPREYINRKINQSGNLITQTHHREGYLRKLKPGMSSRGYSQVTFGCPSLIENGKLEHYLVHRIVGELYISGYFEGAHIDHIDCNIRNNHYTNLQWCTKEYNSTKGNDTTFPLYIEWSK